MVRPILTFALALVVACPALGQVPPFVTSWGSFGTGDSQFNTPVGVDVDSDGIVYVVDINLQCLKRFSRTGTYLSQWPVPNPVAVSVGFDGSIYISNWSGILKYTKTGSLLAQWSGGHFVAADVDGTVYVGTGSGVHRFTSSGVPLADVPSFSEGFEDLDGIAVDGLGHLYTVELSGRVQKFTTSGTFLAQWGSSGTGDGQFDWAARVATSPDGSKVYVVDHLNSRVQVFSNGGAYLGQWGAAGGGPGQFRGPIGIAVDDDGNVFVADTNNSRIQVFGDRITSAVAVRAGKACLASRRTLRSQRLAAKRRVWTTDPAAETQFHSASKVL